MTNIGRLQNDLREFAKPEKEKLFIRYFKAGKGGYAEGDRFLGLKVGETRSVTKKYKDLEYKDLEKLLVSKIHEERMAAVMILVDRSKKGNLNIKKEVYDFFITNLSGINNWDLVDVSTPYIIGGYLFLSKGKRDILYTFAKSDNLWKKRISVLSTFYFIREKDYKDSLEISKILLNDNHDLIHKAVGWMLREIGNRDLSVEEKYLKTCYKKMPRTMLRYAIEKFPEDKRKKYLESKI